MHKRTSLFLSLVTLTLAPQARAADVSVKLDAGTGFAVKNSTGAIERLRVDEATGNVSRNGALFVHTTGTESLFVGPGAGNASTTGVGGNSAFGQDALRYVGTGFRNSGFGTRALRSNTSGSWNSAVGFEALRANTTGTNNTAVGGQALFSNTTGGQNSAFGLSALQDNTTGGGNSAFGDAALANNTSGAQNSAFGYNSLLANTTGINNSAVGLNALRENDTGNSNSAVGLSALRDNTTGSNNSALGTLSLFSNTTGGLNSAVGYFALAYATGNRNVAVGQNAGVSQTTGSDNIYLANTGVAGESGKIKIGTVGTHTQTTIAGISGSTSSGGIAVLVNASGVLGTTTSSARFKQDVRDMGESSDLLMKLRPVTFRYREETVGAVEAQMTQYGLIAEEVAKVAPELVAPDLEGRPYSVKYHELPALLLNEVQEQKREIAELKAQLARLEGRQTGMAEQARR